MPYKVISDNCRVGGRVVPKGTILADNQITGGAAEALLASKQITKVTPETPAAPAAPAPAAPAPAPVKVAG